MTACANWPSSMARSWSMVASRPSQRWNSVAFDAACAELLGQGFAVRYVELWGDEDALEAQDQGREQDPLFLPFLR